MISISQWVYSAILGFVAVVSPPPDGKEAVSHVDEGTFKADAELGFSHKLNFSRNYQTPAALTVIHLDERGARVDSPNGPPIEKVDMITVGGSQAFGHGVLNSETFSSLVAKRHGLSVRNFSIPGQGGVQSLLLLRRNIDLKPRIVLYGFWEDHFKRNVRVCQNRGGPVCMEFPTVQFDEMDEPYIHLPRNAEETFRWVGEWDRYSKRANDSFDSPADLRWKIHRIGWHSLKAMGVTLNTAPVDKHRMNRAAEFVLREMKKSADDIGALLVVAYIPLYFTETVEDTPPELLAAANRLEIPLVGITGRIMELKSQGIEIFIKGDGHLNELGHRIIAEEVSK